MVALQDRRIWFVAFRGKPVTVEQLLDAEDQTSRSFLRAELDGYISARTREAVIALYIHNSRKAWHNRHRDISLRWVREDRLEDW
jgi:hypothetical protein